MENLIRRVVAADAPRPPNGQPDPQAGHELTIERARLCSLLMACMTAGAVADANSDKLKDCRDQLSKAAWKLLKENEHNEAKYFAYIAVCHVISVNPVAARSIVPQVLSALLRAYQPEYKPEVRRALDLLMPTLPVVMPDTDSKGR